MSDAKSNYLEEKLIKHALGMESYTMPSGTWLALCTAEPAETATGTTMAECTYTGYARVEMTGDWEWDATERVVKNTVAVQFPTNTGSVQIATHMVLLDASTTGNILYKTALSTANTISTGIGPQTAAGTVKFAEK